MFFSNLHKNWVCGVCGFRIMCAPGEKSPRHCPKCYKVNNSVVELDKKVMT